MDGLERFKNTVLEHHGTNTLITIEKQIDDCRIPQFARKMKLHCSPIAQSDFYSRIRIGLE